MKLEKIHPFARFVRYLEINKHSSYSETIPCDARIFYLFKGRLTIMADFKNYDMTKNDILIINSGIPYKLITPAKEDAVLLAVNFDYTFSHTGKSFPLPPVKSNLFKTEMLLENASFENAPILNKTLFLKNFSEAESFLVSSEREFSRKLMGYESIISANITNVLISAVRKSGLISNALNPSNDTVNEILCYLNEHYSERLTNSEIGKKFGFHPNYTCFLIKNITGMPLHKYLIHIRLVNAIKLLADTTLSISAISENTGFINPSTFSKTFKKYTGQNPCEYRKNIYLSV